MALVSKLPTSGKVTVPNEPGQWVEFRRLRVGDLRRMAAEGTSLDIAVGAISKALVAWSYDEPISEASIDDQDQDWFLWLTDQIKAFSGIRDETEKKDSANNSSSTTEPETPLPSSPLNSGI